MKRRQYLAVLGRMEGISMAELMALYGEDDVRWAGRGLAIIETDLEADLARMGGLLKLGRVLEEDPVQYLRGLPEGKITLGVSDYRSGRRDGNLGLQIKKGLRRSTRVVPSEHGVVSTAVSHHNKLGSRQNHVELAYFDGGVASVKSQDITGYARRDQVRPARDARVGMLPPKLAQVLINLCGWLPSANATGLPGSRVLDPFCGTGVVLQESVLMGYRAYGTDLSDMMVSYSRINLEWLGKGVFETEQGDATTFKWRQPVDAVASEIYLGPPLSQPPSEIRLRELKEETGGILRGFLKNLAGQIREGVPVVLAIPAWRRPSGSYSGLKILDEVEKLGYNQFKFKGLGDLLYYREGQVVAREIIVLRKS